MKKLTSIVLFSVLVMITSLWSQDLKFPEASPGAAVSQIVGVTKVEITYHRPGVKGRVVWGELVPYNQVWRTGANEATTIEFSHDVMIEENKLAAGKYGLFTIPGKEEWTFIFSKQADIWGTFGYEEAQDVLRVKVKPMDAPFPCEWMHFMFADLKDDSCKVFLHWEKLMVGFTVKVETDAILLKDIEKSMTNSYRGAYSAASFAFEKGMYDKAKSWLEISLAAKKSYWNMLLKAKIYKELAKTKAEIQQAIKLLQEANMLIKDLSESSKQYATEGPKLLEEWTKKK